MIREKIEQAFANAGWELDGGFSGHLVIGEDRDLSVLAHQWACETGDLVFEVCDGERKVTCWVREIPAPRQAATLLDEYGEAPEEERSNSHENDLNDEGWIWAKV